MKWYKLESVVSDNIGVTPTIAYDHKKVKHTYYNSLIDKRKLVDTDKLIYLWMYDDPGVPQIIRDILFWSSGRPDANVIICTDKCRQLFQYLTLPPHRFYAARLRIGKKRTDIYVFHFLQDTYKEINFNHSRFYLSYYNENKPKYMFAIGEIRSVEQIWEINEKQFDNNLWIEPKKLSFPFDTYYDLWSLYGQHIISEKAMLLFKEAGITGIDMIPLEKTEWKHLEIVMPQQRVSEKLSVV